MNNTRVDAFLLGILGFCCQWDIKSRNRSWDDFRVSRRSSLFSSGIRTCSPKRNVGNGMRRFLFLSDDRVVVKKSSIVVPSIGIVGGFSHANHRQMSIRVHGSVHMRPKLCTNSIHIRKSEVHHGKFCLATQEG